MNSDKKITKIINKEKKKQEENINLIASENYISKNILNLGTLILTNKYAEGYIKKRYYSGCSNIDKIEDLAIKRAKKIFNADYVNVQPHSGSQANQAVLLALCDKNDYILGMKLKDGGHLTHGHNINYSGKIYNTIQYGIDETTGNINYDEVRHLAEIYKPKIIIAGASAYSRIIDWNIFRKIADEVNAYLLADISHIAGLIIAKLYPSPINIADVTTSTTQKTLRGPRGGIILAKKNSLIEKKLNSAVFPGIQGGPLMHTIAEKAAAFKEASYKKFIDYQKQTILNAKYMVNYLKEYKFNIVTGGTDTHLFIIDLKNKNINGKEAEKKLEYANILVNKNCIPNDKKSPNLTSGIRIGTPAITTRGFKIKQIKQISEFINNIINKNNIAETKKLVIDLCKKFPIYKNEKNI